MSIALHAVVAAALIFFPWTRQKLLQPHKPLPAQLVTQQQFEAAVNAATAQRPLSVSPPVEMPRQYESTPTSIPRARAQSPEIAPTVRPQRMLSETALADSRSHKVRMQLRTLSADERAVQLCNIEAMEQVHAWKANLSPQTINPYAQKGLQIADGSIIAEGAAFYSDPDWYRLRFECGLRESKVVSFVFSVGDPIPRSEWAANNLNKVADDDDD